jgi:hypothetical protein
MTEDDKNEYELMWEEWLPRIKEYVNTRTELTKLMVVESAAKAAAAVTSNIILFIFFFAFFTFASFALALYIGVLMGAYYWGFTIMAGLYLLLFLLAFVLKKNQIERPIINQTIKKLLEEDDNGK